MTISSFLSKHQKKIEKAWILKSTSTLLVIDDSLEKFSNVFGNYDPIFSALGTPPWMLFIDFIMLQQFVLIN